MKLTKKKSDERRIESTKYYYINMNDGFIDIYI